MKHTGFRLGLLILLFINLLTGKAQTPLTEGGGPSVARCNGALSDQTLLKQDDKSAIFYLHTYSDNPKQQYQGIVTYNKSTGTTYNEDVILPDGYRPLFFRPCGENYFGCYYRLNRTKKSFDYATATFPQKKSTSGVRNITPTVNTSIDITDRADIVKFSAVAPDQSKFAVVLVAPDINYRTHHFYCFVYDKDGNEVWTEKYTPALSGSRFTVHDIELTRKGEILLLVNSVKGKNALVQLFSCTEDGISSVDETVDFGYIQSMKMLRLQNQLKEIFVGGYFSTSTQGGTTGFFNLIYNPDKKTFTSKHHDTFEYKDKTVYDDFTEADYTIKCDHLIELPDKIVMMIGEQYITVQQHGEKSSTAYKHITNNIYGNKFALNGNNLGVIKVQRHISAGSGSLVSQREEGERIGKSALYEKGPAPKMPTFANLGITYSPIVQGSTIYLLYEDLAANYAEDATGWEPAAVEKADNNCVVLTRMDYSADKKVVMMPGKSPQTFHDIWCIDGQDIYFGMSGKKDYSIQKFKLDGRWSWDK